MDVKRLRLDKVSGKAIYLVKGTTPVFMNALRRTIIEAVPVLAIEDVEIRKNSSILYDEMLAHRLGLIPLKTDLLSYRLPEPGKEVDAHSSVKLTLKAKGPKTVYAGDLVSKDPQSIVTFPKMILVTLLKGQEVEFEATAQLGVGKEHIKWASGLVWYKYKPEVTVKKSPANAEEIAKKADGIFELKNKKLVINEEALLMSHQSDILQDLVPEGTLEIKEQDDEFVLFIEPFGQLDAATMVTTALDILGEQLDMFAGNL